MPRSPRSAKSSRDSATAGGERLQKVLAAAGLGSRRECEQLIAEGRVEVDRQFVTELGTRVDPASQEIRVDGVLLPRRKRVYYLLNKPVGILSTNRDPEGRPRVIDLVDSNERLFTVGRLDKSSEGLILVTNDGELANRLTHPRYGVPKTYHVRVAGTMELETLKSLRKGVHLAEGFARVESIRVRQRQRQCTDLEIVLREGRNREIRRVLARVGHKVLSLKRVAIGPLRVGEMPAGAYRLLTHAELRALEKIARQGGRESAGERSSKAGAAKPGGSRSAAGSAKQSGAGGPRRAKPPAGKFQGSVLGGESEASSRSSEKKRKKGKRPR